MLTAHNSIKLITLSTLEAQGSLRELLDSHHIEYNVSVSNPHDIGGFFPVADIQTLMTQDMEYIFYVHQRDAEQAYRLLTQEGYHDTSIEP